MTTKRVGRRPLVLATLVATLALGAGALVARRAHADTKSYDTRGVIKSFGPERSFVRITHEAIPGYMAAMTMPFEPKTPAQLAGLAVGDRVRFTFVETDDGRLVIRTIAKE